MSTLARLHVPERIVAGQDFELRLLLQHPMETGQRADAEGRRLPRDIVTRVEVRLDDRLAWAARLHPAVAFNPSFSIWLRIERAARLEVLWRGDHGFEHRQQADLRPT